MNESARKLEGTDLLGSISPMSTVQEGVPGICCHSEKHHVGVIVMCSCFTQISLIMKITGLAKSYLQA